MGRYKPSWTPNEADSALRYTFQKQPDVSAWNCERLAEAFSSVIGEGPGLACYREELCPWETSLGPVATL